MPIKYIGKTTYLKGKTLWEIVGNLKDFGVGRVIARNVYERYPEPSYFIIRSVDSCSNEENRKVNAKVERVFRGRRYPELINMYRTSYKPDFKLIPKDEEETYCRFNETTEKEVVVLPKTMPLPPLLRELVIRDMKHQGKPFEEPMLEVQYRQGTNNLARIASDGETPTVEIKVALGKPVSHHLYEGVFYDKT